VPLDPLDLDPLSTPSDRIRATLLDDAERNNAEIALAVRCSAAHVSAVRRQLVGLGEPGGMLHVTALAI
jgi:hypothetical protein